jgi:hypothetical protein
VKLALIVVAVLAGCSTLAPEKQYSQEEMMSAAVALSKVSAAAEANLRYGSSSANISDDTFLAQSVAHDPELLKPLASYQVKSMRQDGHAILLLCSQDGTTALLEDAGCSAALDRHRWRDSPRSRCAFSIDAAQLCPPAKR